MLNNKMFYPMLNDDGFIKYTFTQGSITILGNQYAVFNNILRKNISKNNVVFKTEPNKIYHLRYSLREEPINNFRPKRGLYLVAVDDTDYNPDKLSSVSPKFDTTYTDMLLARITTDSKNNISVFEYINLPKLKIGLFRDEGTQVYEKGGNGEGYHAVVDLKINWSRTPKISNLFYEGSTKDNTILQGFNFDEPFIINRERVSLSLFMHTADNTGKWNDILTTGIFTVDDVTFKSYWQKRPTITLELEA